MAAQSRRGTCRIIGGRWRGRKIKFNDAEGLRPTTDRTRETLFNWLQPYVYQARCLDCFAGSGILGFEALSRGATEVLFVEKNRKTAADITANINILAAENAVVKHADALAWLQTAQFQNYFDLVFLDPPFHAELLTNCSALLASSGCLAENAIIYVEHAVNQAVVLPANWACLKQKNSGQVGYKLFENCLPDQRG